MNWISAKGFKKIYYIITYNLKPKHLNNFERKVYLYLNNVFKLPETVDLFYFCLKIHLKIDTKKSEK